MSDHSHSGTLTLAGAARQRLRDNILGGGRPHPKAGGDLAFGHASGGQPQQVADRCLLDAASRRRCTCQSFFKRQTDILLRQRRLGVLGGVQIIELVQPHLFLERRLTGKAVQEHRQPPGHARGGVRHG